MSEIVRSAISFHNQEQLEYFGKKVKKTMIPVESPYVMNHIRHFLQFTDILVGQDILEVGCGMGKFTFPLLKAGCKITGLDISPYLLQKFLEYNEGRFNTSLICSDILEIPEEYNERFDKVIGFFALHHFHHLETYFQAMARVLKPGGEIIFVEPNAFNPFYYLQIFITPGMNWKGDKGVAQMRPKVFQKAAKYAGLKMEKIDSYGFFPPFIANKSYGLKLDHFLEKQALLKPILPFQLVRLVKTV
ncbi:class I SAM-dependent methyltransferase [Roseivirga sp.]|uniref:class I SAM-dependent methyltransferase n=1 Tax=Roseivirga sp. TaxID=1964215 RepID=UPI003BADAEDC